MDSRDTTWLNEIQVQYPLITETSLSPDGSLVVYGVREPLMTDDESRYLTHLYLVAVAGGDPIQITCGSCANHTARWSPDGQYLAFLSDRGSTDDERRVNVYVMRLGGGEPWALTAFTDTDVADLAWSPDGVRLAFLMVDPPSEEKAAAQKAKDDAILWDEDFDFRHVYTVPFREMPRTLPAASKLTAGRFHVLKLAWLPDGGSLALTTQPTPGMDDWPAVQLVTVPSRLPDGGEPFGPEALCVLGSTPAFEPQPFPSPDGDWIACPVSDMPARWAGSWRIALFRTDGSEQEPRMLAATPDEKCLPLGWSADGSCVLVYEGCRLSGHVLALPADGAACRTVLTTPTAKFAYGRAESNVITFAEEDFAQPNAVQALDIATGAVRAVAAPAMPAAWPAELPEVEVLRWRGPGGLEVEGIVTYSLGRAEGEMCPLVVHVHGGPAGVFERRYLAWPDRQCDTLALAARGVAVLRVNPRGSSNYGKSFRYANYGDWGGGDFGDIMAGIDLLVERGVADPDRIGILGWSYGGYMTSWAITHSDRFKAAVVGAGVTNLMSFTGTADIPGFLPDYFDGEPWEVLQRYLDYSAMGSADNLSTPTLVQHGDEDLRVPLGQGRELYNALKRQGVPSQMVIYPRQGHGISEPRLRIDVRGRAVEWLLRWLDTDG